VGLLAVHVLNRFPTFSFTGFILFFGVLAVALVWGIGPSLLATVIGALILIIFNPHGFFVGSPGAIANLIGLGLYVLMGGAICFFVSQTIQARHNAEFLAQSFQQEQSRLAAVIEAVPDELSIHDTHGNLLQINQATHEATAISAHSLPSQTMRDLLPLWTPSGEQVTEQDVPLTAVAHGEPIRGREYLKYLADGQQRYLSVSMAPVAVDDEEVVVISHDITELKQAQHAEAQRANEFSVLFDSLVDGVIVMDSEGNIVKANAAFRQLYTDPHLMKWSFSERIQYFNIRNDQGEVISLEALPSARILRGEVLQGPTSVDLQISSPSQGIRHYNANGAPLRNEAGEITGGVMVLRDFTERRQWEKRTQDTLDALVAITSEIVRIPGDQEVPDGSAMQHIVELIYSVLGARRLVILTLDPANGELSVAAVTGVSPDLAEQVHIHFTGKGLDSFLSTEQVARLRQGEELPISLLTVAGITPVTPRALLAPMMVEYHLIGVISIAIEAPHKTADAEVTVLTATLARLTALVVERERLFHQRSAAQARILALQQAKERMNTFLNLASHELRTPLTSIIGYIQLAQRRLSRQLAAEHYIEETQAIQLLSLLEDANSQAALLNRLVEDLLDVSRAEGKKLSLHRVVEDLTEVVQEATDGQRAAWTGRHLVLRQEEATSLPVEMDRVRILQVLTNYLTNAMKYSSADRPVQVSVQREGSVIRVEVADQGPGIPLEEQERIWERFYRVESHESVIPGLGMGLYLCRMIIEQHGGQVGVESQPGAGSRFWFRLPLVHETRTDS